MTGSMEFGADISATTSGPKSTKMSASACVHWNMWPSRNLHGQHNLSITTAFLLAAPAQAQSHASTAARKAGHPAAAMSVTEDARHHGC